MVKRNVRLRLLHIMWYSDLEATRLSLAFGSFLWAAMLLWPGELFTPTRITYTLMAQMASEEVWAAAFLVQGSTMLYSLLCGYRSRLTYIVDAMLGCALWTASTFACFLSHYQSMSTYQPPAAMSYEVIAALASLWVLVRYSLPKKVEK